MCKHPRTLWKTLAILAGMVFLAGAVASAREIAPDFVELAKRLKPTVVNISTAKVKNQQMDPADITEQVFAQHLYTRNLPDPDLLIRTSGEMRISNFLLWQISYTELVVTQTLWPDFRKPQFYAALEEYNQRHRRFGGL